MVVKEKMFYYGIPGKWQYFKDCLFYEELLGDLTSELQSNSLMQSLGIYHIRKKLFLENARYGSQ